MVKKDLILNGKRFISSKRAAQITGYTQDYVGQLARGGKIEATVVGRSWFVDEDSILKHKMENLENRNAPKEPRKLEPSRQKLDKNSAQIAGTEKKVLPIQSPTFSAEYDKTAGKISHQSEIDKPAPLLPATRPFQSDLVWRPFLKPKKPRQFSLALFSGAELRQKFAALSVSLVIVMSGYLGVEVISANGGVR